MKKKEVKVKNKKKFSWKQFFASLKANGPIIVLALADVVSFALPEYLENFIPQLYDNLDLTASQYSQATATYGYVSLPGYLIGSYLGDKFKAKSLIIASLIFTSLFGLWYLTLPISAAFTASSQPTFIQLNIIFAGLAVSICTLLWGPLWKLVKNHNTEELKGKAKESKVGANNGYEGTMNGLLGLILALIGTLFIQLNFANILPNIVLNGKVIQSGFFISILLYVSLMIASIFLTLVYVKAESERFDKKSFSLKSIGEVLKNWQIWLLAMLVLGVYMLQMGLSSYINYLKVIFLLPLLAVTLVGIFRTYAMRFLVSSWFGKKADKGRSYILWMVIGLFIGIIFVAIGIVLPGFGNNFDPKANPTTGILLQVAAAVNFIILGAITWALVTIRFSPLGAELNVKNENYATALNILSTIAFTPKAFFKQIRSAIESQHHIGADADQLGNQLILAVVAGFALFGCISGLILYILLYRKSEDFIFKRRANKEKMNHKKS